MYALINTFDVSSPRYVGHVVSVHRTVEAARAADARLRAAVQRKYGAQSYLPTIIRRVLVHTRKGQRLEATEVGS
jgi:hypothetical protein